MCQFTEIFIVLGVPKITFSFGDSLESVQDSAGLRFLAVKGYKTKSAQRKKAHGAKSRENELFRHKFLRVLTQWSHTGRT